MSGENSTKVLALVRNELLRLARFEDALAAPVRRAGAEQKAGPQRVRPARPCVGAPTWCPIRSVPCPVPAVPDWLLGRRWHDR